MSQPGSYLGKGGEIMLTDTLTFHTNSSHSCLLLAKILLSNFSKNIVAIGFSLYLLEFLTLSLVSYCVEYCQKDAPNLDAFS